MKNKDLKSIYSGKTFAEAASIISNKYKKRDTDLTQKLSYEMEIAELMKLNEAVKMQSEADAMVKDKLKCGGKMKYNNGGELNKKNKLSKNEIPHKDAGKPVNQENLFMLPYLGATPPDNIGMQAPLMPQAPLASAYNPTTSVSDSIGNTLRSAMSGPGRINVQPPLKEGESFQILQQPKKPGLLKRMFGPDSNIYNPALAGLAANMGLNAAILAGGYDKEAPQTNKYESDVRRLMEGRGIDSTAVQNRINASMRANMENTQNVRSANVRNALLQNIGATAMEQTSGAELQAQQLRNQLTGEYAGMLNNLGLQESQARMASRELTARNKGQFLTNLSQFGQMAAEGGKFFTKLKANDKLNELYTNILNLMFEDFGVGTDLVKKIRNGEEFSADDIVQMKNSKNSMIRQFAEYYERTGSTPTSKTSTTAGKKTTPES